MWASAGRHGGSKIEHFGTRKHQKSEKWCPGRGVGKSLKVWWNFDWKTWAWEEKNHWFFIVFPIESCFRRFSKKLEHLIENGSQNAQSIKKLNFSVPGSDLVDKMQAKINARIWWRKSGSKARSRGPSPPWRVPFGNSLPHFVPESWLRRIYIYE